MPKIYSYLQKLFQNALDFGILHNEKDFQLIINFNF